MTDLPYPLWTSASRTHLSASRDKRSGELVFPALAEASPLAGLYETVPLDSIGTVYSYTVIHPSAKSGESPYALGLVDLPGPVRIFGRLEGKPRPSIGERYQVRPDDRLGYVFVAVNA